jgi:hypothetical protein
MSQRDFLIIIQMNLKNLTKADLIKQIESIKTENKNNNKKSWIQRFLEFLIFYKNLMFKITIVALIIKILRKYSILNKIWRILNTIVMSTFGITMFDIYGFDIFYNLFKEISTIFGNIIDYLSKTHFSSILKKLFDKKEVENEFLNETSKNETGSLRSLNRTTSEISNGNTENKTNSSRIEQIDENNQKTPFYKDGYFIIGAILIIGGLFCYFWFKPSKPDTGGNVIDNDVIGNINDLNNLNREQLQSRLQKLFEENISDNSSDVSDKTVTQQFNKYLPETKTETKVEEFIQGSSTESIQTRDVSNTRLPSILFSSNFFNQLDDDIKLEDKTTNEDNQEEPHEVKIQDDDSTNIINTWEKVEVKFLDENFVNILFGRMSKESKSILINTTDKQEINYNLSFNLVNNFTNDNFNWRSKLKEFNSTVEIKEIFIQDLNNIHHLVYSKNTF